MGIIKKIKKRGIKGTIKYIKDRIAIWINDKSYNVFLHLPINDKLIVMESEGDLSDNAYALYDYMRQHGYLKRYKVVWLVNDVKKCKYIGKKSGFENTKFVVKYPVGIEIDRSKYLATSKWYIYDHCNLMDCYKERRNTVIYLCHGSPGFKKGKNSSNANSKPVCFADYIIVFGKLSVEWSALYASSPNARFPILGFSRLDYFYSDLTETRKLLNMKYGFDLYGKVLLWMPTFRQCNNECISEDYIANETGIPLISTYKDMEEFNSTLQDLNDLIILKRHHLQKKLDLFSREYSNIIFVDDKDIQNIGIQLYQFIPCTDALITDYSSVSVDYMLLNKPIVYVLDDYEEYNKSRGVLPDNAIEYMKGDHVTTKEEFIEALERINKGQDIYKEERNQLLPLFHEYTDGNSSKRILEYFGL